MIYRRRRRIHRVMIRRSRADKLVPLHRLLHCLLQLVRSRAKCANVRLRIRHSLGQSSHFVIVNGPFRDQPLGTMQLGFVSYCAIVQGSDCGHSLLSFGYAHMGYCKGRWSWPEPDFHRCTMSRTRASSCPKCAVRPKSQSQAKHTERVNKK